MVGFETDNGFGMREVASPVGWSVLQQLSLAKIPHRVSAVKGTVVIALKAYRDSLLELEMNEAYPTRSLLCFTRDIVSASILNESEIHLGNHRGADRTV